MKIYNIAKLSGYDSTEHFLNSTFHPENFQVVMWLTGIFGTLGYIFKIIFGVDLPVGISIFLLFTLEMYTGIKASKKDGQKFSSDKFQKGWLKLGIYMIMIGCSNAFAKHIPQPSIIGISFDIYEWLHYAFYNYVILQLIISNLENFGRLGWDEYLPILKKLTKVLNIKSKKNENS